jgi:hypothetical protein
MTPLALGNPVIAEKPTSSRTMHTTFGAPAGPFRAPNGD